METGCEAVCESVRECERYRASVCLHGRGRRHIALARPFGPRRAAHQRPQAQPAVAPAPPCEAPPVVRHRQAVDVRRRRGHNLAQQGDFVLYFVL